MQLSVYPGFGDTIKIIAPLADIGPTGETVPGVSQFEVSGLFRTGIYNWDSKYILADIDSAISLLGLQARKGFLIWLVSPGDVNRCKTILTKNLPEGWNVQSWNDKNERLFSALKLERIAMSAILVMALLISSFSISVIVLMLVSSKKKDIAIMRSVGMQDRDIKKIFLVCAGMIGAAGSTLGTILGLAVCIVLKFSPPVLPASYYLDFLPVRISFPATAAFWLTGVAVAVIAAIYPVRKTGTTDVVEALRYE
jgi:lipoprotein-releasing system permease protein